MPDPIRVQVGDQVVEFAAGTSDKDMETALAEMSTPESGAHKIWRSLNTPLVSVGKTGPMGEAIDQLQKEHPVIGTAGKFATDTMEQMTSPLSLGLMGAEGGAVLAEKALPTLSSAVRGGIRLGGKAAATGAVAHGGYKLVEGDTPEEKTAGALEAVAGGAGLIPEARRVAGSTGRGVLRVSAPMEKMNPWGRRAVGAALGTASGTGSIGRAAGMVGGAIAPDVLRAMGNMLVKIGDQAVPFKDLPLYKQMEMLPDVAAPEGGRTSGPPVRLTPPKSVAERMADQNATKLDTITKAREGMVAKKPTISESVSATTPEGSRVSMRTPFGKEDQPTGTMNLDEPFKVAGQTVKPGTPAYEAIRKSLEKQGSIRVHPPVSPVEQTVEDAQRGYSGAERRGTTGTSPTGTERRGGAAGPSVGERATELRKAGITPPASKPEGAAMVNKAVQEARAGSVRTTPPAKSVPPSSTGATDEQVIALRTQHGAEEAGTMLAKDPRFAGMPKNQRTNAIRDIAGDEAGQLPTAAQKDIDTKLAKMHPDEAEAYLAKAPNAAAYNYITKRMRALDLLVDSED